MRKVAIFDIDGTMFRSSLLIELVEGLIQADVFPLSAPKQYTQAYLRWLSRKDSYQKYIEAVVETFIKHIKGVAYKDFLQVAKKVTAFHQDRVYRYTRDLLSDLKRRDYYLLAISHSPKGIVEEFCREYGFDKVYGHIYETDAQKKFTGKVLHQDLIIDKAKVLERAVAQQQLTLKDSVGVGDTESDIPFLRLVKKPICFNPNNKLYVYAKRQGWKVVVERKDVIYSMRKP